MENIGFIGLGIMGKNMAKNLIKDGYSLVVFDIDPITLKEFQKEGGQVSSTVMDLAGKCNIIITMLPDSPQSEEVIIGNGGIIQSAVKGTMVIDMSS